MMGIVGLYRAHSAPPLDSHLSVLPMHDWTCITVTPLEPHPDDPELGR
jgi:muconolactone delta-isomerase